MKRIFAIILLSTLSACMQTGEDEYKNFEITDLSQIAINFDFLKEKVLAPKCLSCHAWAATETQTLKYVKKGQPELSPLFIAVDNGSMPLGGTINDSQKEMIKLYIAGLSAAAPTPTPSPTPMPDKVTYAMLKSSLLDDKCIGCHDLMSTEEGLMDFFTPGSPNTSPLYLRTADGTMPLYGSPLPEDQLKMIKRYIQEFTTGSRITDQE